MSGIALIGIGQGNGAQGVYNLNGGLLEVGTAAFKNNFRIGVGFETHENASTATFNVNGGRAVITGNLEIANAGKTGFRPDATVNISGGEVTVGGKVNFGAGVGRLNLNGGALVLGGSNAITGVGQLSFAGGAIQASSDLSVNHAATVTGAGAIFDSNGHQITYSGVISGSGGVTKLGDGVLLLNVANTYDGGTTLRGGMLETGHASALGTGGVTLDGGALKLTTLVSLAGGLTAGAAGGTIDVVGQDLTVNGGGDGVGGVSFINSQSATPALITLDSGLSWSGETRIGENLTLATTAANQLSAASTLNLDAGAELINGGFVQTLGGLTGSGSISTAGDLSVGANGASTQYDGVISGAGGLTKLGAGQLTLTQAQAYNGATTVNAGVLALSGSGAFADNGAFLLNGGALDLGGTTLTADTVHLTGGAIRNGVLDADLVDAVSGDINVNLSGNGQLVKSGSGVTRMTGDNTGFSGTVDVVAGELRGPIASFGANRVITNAGLVSFVESGDAVWDGAITGSGSLRVTGGGRFEIVGSNNTYSGNTLVENASLRVNGALPNSVVVLGADSRLGGNGVIGGLQASGVVAPGNSIGTLNVAGNVGFAAGSTYEVEVNAAGASDRIAATGAATITGGKVAVLAEAGVYDRRTHYTILTADGGVSGRFNSVTSNMAYLTPSLSYGATSVNLSLDRNDQAFGYVAATRNQFATANAVERLGFGNAVYDAILFTSPQQARAGFDMLSGEIHAALTSTAVTEATIAREAVLDRLRSAHGGVRTVAQANAPATRSGAGAAFWGQGFGSWGESKSQYGLASVDRRSGGFILGADARFHDVTVGVAGGFINSQFDMSQRLSRGSTQTVFGALYAGTNFGAMQLSAGMLYAGSRVSTNRGIAFDGFADYASAKYDASTFQVFGEAAYRIALGAQAGVSPFVNATALRLNSDGFAERGGPAALVGFGRTDDIGVITAGLRVDATLGAIGSTGTASLSGTIGWRGAFGDVRPTSLNAFRSDFTATPFAIESVPVDRSALIVGAGVDWAVTSAVKLGLTYSGQYGAKNSDQQFRARAEVRF